MIIDRSTLYEQCRDQTIYMYIPGYIHNDMTRHAWNTRLFKHGIKYTVKNGSQSRFG